MEALDLILKYNVFTFDGSFFLQTQSVAMGTPCTPSYDNLYLGWWEQQLLADKSLLMYLCHILLWHRYIHDIFVIWDGSRLLFEEFSAVMGRNALSPFFTMSYSQESITLLDVKAKVTSNDELVSDLFRKPSTGNSILDYKGFYPKPLIKSIPVGPYLHFRRRLCSDESNFNKQTNSEQD